MLLKNAALIIKLQRIETFQAKASISARRGQRNAFAVETDHTILNI